MARGVRINQTGFVRGAILKDFDSDAGELNETFAEPAFRDKSHRAAAAQFFVAAELSRRGMTAVLTIGNCPNTDILCSNKEATTFVHIQVKTFRPGDKTCMVGTRAEEVYGPNFFWVVAGIPQGDQDSEFQYFVIPAKDMSRNIRECFEEWMRQPGKNGQVHNETNKTRALCLPPRKNLNGWSIKRYLGRWDLIEKRLGRLSSKVKDVAPLS